MGMVKEFKFSNGDKVKEKITGFIGTITGTCFYITGCNQYLVVPACTDTAKAAEGTWYDEGRLELVETESVSAKSVAAEANGCDIAPSIGRRGN